MMLDDPDYVSSVNKLIEKEHANAEYAVTKVAHKFEKQFLEMDNDYMRGRAADVIDISRRVKEILMMHAGKLKNMDLPLITRVLLFLQLMIWYHQRLSS